MPTTFISRCGIFQRRQGYHWTFGQFLSNVLGANGLQRTTPTRRSTPSISRSYIPGICVSLFSCSMLTHLPVAGFSTGTRILLFRRETFWWEWFSNSRHAFATFQQQLLMLHDLHWDDLGIILVTMIYSLSDECHAGGSGNVSPDARMGFPFTELKKEGK